MTKKQHQLFNACLLLVLLTSLAPAFAGGPLILFAPGTPFKYPGPLVLFTDNDPMFSTTAPITNAMADATAAAAIAEWTAVPTATFVGSVGGDFASIGLPDITLANVGLVLGAFNGGGYHIIYDHNGAIIAALAGPGVLGFSGPEFAIGPDLIESVAVLNGASVSATDVTLSAWSGVFTHEFGHGINLAHSQTNGAIVFFGNATGPSGCPAGGLPYVGTPTFADLETMYPFIDPSPPVTSGPDQFTVDQLDDIASVSNVYPAAGWPGSTRRITGTIFLSNGTTPIGGVNVIARNVADPFGDAISALSGDFTQTPGDGLYTFNGLTPGASYVVYVDGIVAGGFSQTPISLPGPEEFFNGAAESSNSTTDDPCASSGIVPVAGTPFTANIIFNASSVVNDLCANAVTVSCGSSTAGTTIGAFFDAVGTCGTTNTAPGVWYKFVGTGDFVTASTCNAATFDTKISVFSGSCTALNCIGGVDDSPGCAGFTTQFSWSTVPGVDYFILVHGFGSATGNFTLSISCVPQFGNDACTGALPIACGGTVTGTTVGKNFDGVGTCGTTNTAPGVWYSFAGTGEAVTATTCNPGTTYDTKLSVFAGSCAALSCVTGNDDVTCAFGLFRSSVTWFAAAGVNYQILVHGFGSATGNFELSLSCQPIANAEPNVCYGTTGRGGANPGSFFTINANTGTATLVGPTGQSAVPGLAINSKGEVFGTAVNSVFTGDTDLIRINAATGASAAVGRVTSGAVVLDFMDAIAFDANDVLYGIDVNNDLYTINPVTGAATLVGFTGVTPTPFLVGMAFDPGTRRLFASTGGLGTVEDIYEINPATAAATLIGSTGLGGDAIPDLHFVNGKLFGSENIGGTFNLISINSSTGAGAVVGLFGAGLRMSGLASFILPHVLLADENVEIDRQVNSDGDIHANHSIIFKEGNRPNSTHTGDLTAGDNIIIGKRNRIVGAAMADNDVDNQGAVTGGVTEHVNVTRFPLEDMPGILHGVNNIIVGENKSRTLAPGNYNQIKVAKHGTLRLSSGVYNISSLEMSENSLLLINLSSGNPISINADDRVKLLKKVNMKLVPATASTVLITFNVDEDDTDGDDKVLIGDESRAFGTFNVPEGTVELGMKARLKGAVFAENIRVKMGARFVHHSSAAKFPKESDESEVDESEVVADNVITDYVLEQNYPNPFNPSTKIKFDLPEAGTVELQIYDLVGNLVKTLVSAPHSAGHHEASWNGRNSAGKPVAGGVYLYRIKVERANGAAPMVITKKMTFLK